MADRCHRQPGLLSADDSVLIVIDVQERLLSAMSTDDSQRVVANTVKLLTAAEGLGVPVLSTEQYPKGLGATHPDVIATLPSTTRRFEKTAFSCCRVDAFVSALRATGRSQAVLVGQETHVCVLQTAFDLLAEGCRTFVIDDAVCSRSQGHKHNALARMEQAGVAVVSMESVLFEWLRDARHPQFKSLSVLVK